MGRQSDDQAYENGKLATAYVNKQKALEHQRQKLIFELNKSDVKKNMRRQLRKALNQQSDYQETCKLWLKVLCTVGVLQRIHADYRALKEQFSQSIKVTAILQIYLNRFSHLLCKNGPTYDSRAINNSVIACSVVSKLYRDVTYEKAKAVVGIFLAKAKAKYSLRLKMHKLAATSRLEVNQ